MKYEDLPPFLKKRVDAMPEAVRGAFVAMLTPDWVDTSWAMEQLRLGVEQGKWTWEDVRREAQQCKEERTT